MLYVLLGTVVGAVVGGFRARARGGNGFDIAQYAAVHALIGGVLMVFVTIWLLRQGAG
ncbi:MULTISPECIES: hypothetical protein [Haematobacter]|uniref:Apolipoprotein acyltransferase n=1 Tax=Haematobacter genomosp. 1 TaxID=366618 RepID=A0A212ADA4_9RHOB|nr:MULTISPECIES: hypothetical protein [Haematobacter]OWJ78974.1 hypothetical protein CDV49_07760 [Haematobacter genomosp. 1]